jgi:hypothetical protein
MPRVSSHFSIQDPRFGSVVFFTTTPATITADAAVTYTTDQVLGGMIIHSSLTTGRTATLPTAALLAEAIQGAFVGLTFNFTVAPTGGTLTVAVGTGGTAVGTMTCVTTAFKTFAIRFTNVGIGTEAYSVYSLGTATA